jgi:hypothetical protein
LASPDGFIVYSHAGDDWRACKDYVMERLGYDRRRQRRPVEDRSAGAVALWNNAQDPERTVRLYLARRGLALPDDVAGRVVRFHPACPRGQDRQPAMLTAFRTIAHDRLVAIHRTFLSDDGRKLDRRMLGPVANAAIKVDPDEAVELGLFIGEGFETCLAARMLGFRPTWALGSAGAIGNFPVLAGIEAITFLAETDDNGANARAARSCARKWIAAGHEAYVVVPGIGGDMNDLVSP